MNLVQKLQKVDSRIIYLLMLAVTIIPLLRPVGIPLNVSPMTRAVYDIIEGLNPAKDVVLVAMDYSPGAGLDADVSPRVVIEHLVQRGIKWVGISFDTTDGPMMTNRVITGFEERGLKYGVDFANLGYMAGGENAIRQFALDCSIVAKDSRGNATASLPVMKGIKSIKDFAFVLQFSMGSPEAWIRQVVDPMGVKFALGTVTVSVPSVVPYYNSGQLKGLMGGLSSGAQYEHLLKKPGRGLAMMDAQSMSHLLIILFIVLGNIGYFMTRDKKKMAGSS